MSMLELRGDTIAAVATPNAVGGISVVRISGPDALQTADRIFRTVSGRPLASYKGYTAAYGHILREGRSARSRRARAARRMRRGRRRWAARAAS